MTDGPSKVVSIAERAEQRQASAVDPKNPVHVAREFLRRGRIDGWDALLTVRGEFLAWNGQTHFETIERALLARQIYELLEALGGKMNRYTVIEVQHALEAATVYRGTAPCWREGADGPAPDELVPLRNGVLDPSTRLLRPHSAGLFVTAVAPVEYDAAATCPAFDVFIANAVPDAESRVVLQRFFGMLVASRTTQYQRILALIGATRSGKGVLLRLLQRLVGEEQTAAPMLQSLGTRFGLAGLVGRSVAVVSDARMPVGQDAASAIEVLLRLSGEDLVYIDRKFGDAYSARLPCRIVLASNEVPRLPDFSSALAGRFVIIRTGASHYGHEDHGLEARLHAEASGILNWCLDGWDDLRKVGRLDQPDDGSGLVEVLRDAGSPIGQFVRECCIVDSSATISKLHMFSRWRDWCSDAGRSHAGTDSTFATMILAAAPAVRPMKLRDACGQRIPSWAGIRLRESGDA